MRQRAHLGMRGGFLSDMDCWIAKEVSAISFPDTLENLLKSISGCRDVHSTLSVVPLDATKLTDGKLLFKLFFLHSRISRAFVYERHDWSGVKIVSVCPVRSY